MQGTNSSFLKYCKIILRKKICSKLLRAVRSKCNFVMCYANKGFVFLFSAKMFDWCFTSHSYGFEGLPVCYFALILEFYCAWTPCWTSIFCHEDAWLSRLLLYNFIHLFIVITCSNKGKKLENVYLRHKRINLSDGFLSNQNYVCITIMYWKLVVPWRALDSTKACSIGISLNTCDCKVGNCI